MFVKELNNKEKARIHIVLQNIVFNNADGQPAVLQLTLIKCSIYGTVSNYIFCFCFKEDLDRLYMGDFIRPIKEKTSI
jgi:hypothetical protein